MATLPANGGAVAHFDSAGVTIGRVGSQTPLRLRFEAWGPAGGERLLEDVAPAFGECVVDTLPDGSCVRRLEYARRDVTAWWVGQERGVEFGWTVPEAPDDARELHFVMVVEGADWVGSLADGAEIVDADGTVWNVSSAVAWDAEGAPLPAWLSVEGDALVVGVDAQGATWPVTVDPVLSAASSTLTEGGSSDYFGSAIAGVGDVNGDGYDDIVVGGWGYSEGTGRAYVYEGSASGVGTTAVTTLTGEAAADWFGYSVAGAGDVNNDGYDDVIVGAPNGGGATGTGRAYLFHGSASGVTSRVTTILNGGAVGSFGRSVASAHDVNADGYDDVIVGASGNSYAVGAAYIFHGSASGVASRAARSLTGSADGGYFGGSVAGIGDVNMDGYDDVAVGEPFEYSSPAKNGRAYVFHGSSSGVEASAACTLSGSASGDAFGSSVALAGDVNADGYSDLAVGIPLCGGGVAAGCTNVYHGSSSGVATGPSRVLTGTMTLDYFGGSVSGVGDLDNDGYDDLAVGATHWTYEDFRGVAYIYAGTASGVSASPIGSMPGPSRGYIAGLVAGAGDVNGDGHGDLVIGSGVTQAYVHHGFADADGDGIYVGGDSATAQDCNDADPSVGTPVPRYSDADGDGFGTSATANVCRSVEGYADMDGDCDDTRADVNPAAVEICDRIDTDENCNGASDDRDPTVDAAGMSTWYADRDSDGFGDETSATMACDAPSGYIMDSSDCDDTRSDVNPGSDEVPSDGVDQNCDGADPPASDTGDEVTEAPSDDTSAGCSASGAFVGNMTSLLLAVTWILQRTRRAGSIARHAPLSLDG